MTLPDGRPLVVDPNILVEPSPGVRVVLWVPAIGGDGPSLWDRVATAAGAEVVTRRGIRSVPAASAPARRAGGGLRGLLRRVAPAPGGDRGWAMPGGATATPCGPRRDDLRLAWPEDDAPLDEARILGRWPQCGAVRAIGPRLHIVGGVARDRDGSGLGDAEEGSPRALAEGALAASRRTGDRGARVAALADLGVTHLHEGDAAGASGILEAALAGACDLGDRAGEADIMGNLGQALIDDPAHRSRARDLFAAALGYSRGAGDRHGEKLILDRLAVALSGLGDVAGALDCLGRAAALAAELGDLRHEAEVLWRVAILQEEAGRGGEASAAAGASVERLRRLGHPAAGWYADHLTRHDRGAGRASRPPEPISRGTASGPGLLRMAMTSAGAMARFIGSGFEVATPGALRGRLDACATCEHHTGVRCRACGCLTAVKARLAHERCPTGRWPS